MSKQRKKGTLMETAVARYFGLDRAPLRGAKDTGDIAGMAFDGEPFVIEVKNCNEYDVGGWMRELEREMANASTDLGCVIFHRRRVDPFKDMDNQLVLMSVATLRRILGRTGK